MDLVNSFFLINSVHRKIYAFFSETLEKNFQQTRDMKYKLSAYHLAKNTLMFTIVYAYFFLFLRLENRQRQRSCISASLSVKGNRRIPAQRGGRKATALLSSHWWVTDSCIWAVPDPHTKTRTQFCLFLARCHSASFIWNRLKSAPQL